MRLQSEIIIPLILLIAGALATVIIFNIIFPNLNIINPSGQEISRSLKLNFQLLDYFITNNTLYAYVKPSEPVNYSQVFAIVNNRLVNVYPYNPNGLIVNPYNNGLLIIVANLSQIPPDQNGNYELEVGLENDIIGTFDIKYISNSLTTYFQPPISAFYPYFFQPTNLTISSSNSQGYLAQLPQCTITSNPYPGGHTGTFGLFNCIAINYGAISAVVWFYEPSDGQGVLLSFQSDQYPFSGGYTPWLYIGTNNYLYGGDYCYSPQVSNVFVQISTPISTGWHMAVIEEYYSNGNFYVVLYLDGKYIGQASSNATPQLFGNDDNYPYNDIGTGLTGGGWPYGKGGWFFFNGTIAYVALYNTVLNQTQVQQLYQAGFPNTLFSNNLVAAYILDPTYYNNNSYYFIPYYVNYQLMNQMGINYYNAISITPSGNVGPIPSSQFIYEPNPPIG